MWEFNEEVKCTTHSLFCDVTISVKCFDAYEWPGIPKFCYCLQTQPEY